MQRHGEEAYGERRFHDSRHWLLAPATLGNGASQALLGAMHAMGQGGTQDGPAAQYWLERAANGDVVEAQTMLGALYAAGVVLPQDPEKAIRWLAKAAARGDGEAARLLRAYRRPTI